MNEILKTEEFDAWLKGVKDPKAKAAIAARIERAEQGNFGDAEPVGEGVSEMRIHTGKGYRVYYVRDGKVVYVLLAGGTKATQKKDIKNAIEMSKLL